MELRERIAKVIEQHGQTSTSWFHEERKTGWTCTCGDRQPGDHSTHQADAVIAHLALTGPQWAVDETWDGLGVVQYIDEEEARRAYRVQYDNPTRRLLRRYVTPWEDENAG